MNPEEKDALRIKLEFLLDYLDSTIINLENISEVSKKEIECVEISDRIKNSVYEIFDKGVLLNRKFAEKFITKYWKDYLHNFIFRILYNSYHLDKILDEDDLLEGMDRIEEFVANFGEFRKFLKERLNTEQIEIKKVQDYIKRHRIN